MNLAHMQVSNTKYTFLIYLPKNKKYIFRLQIITSEVHLTMKIPKKYQKYFTQNQSLQYSVTFTLYETKNPSEPSVELSAQTHPIQH